MSGPGPLRRASSPVIGRTDSPRCRRAVQRRVARLVVSSRAGSDRPRGEKWATRSPAVDGHPVRVGPVGDRRPHSPQLVPLAEQASLCHLLTTAQSANLDAATMVARKRCRGYRHDLVTG